MSSADVAILARPPDPFAVAEGSSGRVAVAGKFFAVEGRKAFIRGVTYGAFDPAVGDGYPGEAVVAADFSAMVATGINAVRSYTVPPRRVLDAAHARGLRVLVGIPWEQHVTFLDHRARRQAIERRVREAVRSCAGHPAVLGYAVGNEIPAPVVRWYGARRIERWIERLCGVARVEDSEALVTYVNYPTTEYLRLPFLDFVAFNVYLEAPERLSAYIARLHSLAGDRPVVLAEIGLDSRRNGPGRQAESVEAQVRRGFASGAAGAFVFAWTDEWHRGGQPIDDWDFGLVDRVRRPKPALAAVSRAFAEIPLPPDGPWPSISVVVCSYNGGRVIRDCLEGLRHVDYPDFEVIVVDDGSTDGTAAIAAEYDVRLIRTPNRGLSAARNTGLEAARGEIVAYIDDDARPDPDWLLHLGDLFRSTSHAAAGGPNIAPPGDGRIAACVANAPGGPVHVLISDTEAEHVPGCNMAFRADRLRAIGGFDPRFRAAGDDVDACWRISDAGGTIGFHAGAMVWHHRRDSVRAYWKQQLGYGKAEALLERKWPGRFNPLGHLRWTGRLYGRGLTEPVRRARGRIYGGTWGSAAYQSLYEPAPGLLTALPLMPEWYLVVVALLGLALLGLTWAPLLAALPLLVLAVAAPIVQALLSARGSTFPGEPASGRHALRLRATTALLHLLQPLARLKGRLGHGLTLWRLRPGPRQALALPRPRRSASWAEEWRPAEERPAEVERQLGGEAAVVRGGATDGWDLELRAGILASARLLTAVEEHGSGRQLARWRVSPHVSALGVGVVAAFALLATFAGRDGAYLAAAILAVVAVAVAARLAWEASRATGTMLAAVRAAAKALREVAAP